MDAAARAIRADARKEAKFAAVAHPRHGGAVAAQHLGGCLDGQAKGRHREAPPLKTPISGAIIFV